jgi:ribonucleoside-diphosphate reductase alpha chain
MTEQTLLRGQRRELPNPRRTVRWHLRVNGQGVYVDAGMYANGEVGELFIDIAKEGTALRTALDQWSKAVSYMIQWGVPLERIIKSARWTHCEPCGPVAGHPDVVTCTSIYDAVAQLLAIEFLHDWERVRHKHWYTGDPSTSDNQSLVETPVGLIYNTGDLPNGTAQLPQKDPKHAEMVAQARQGGYEGNPCKRCGALKLVRKGACLYCLGCNESEGCS